MNIYHGLAAHKGGKNRKNILKKAGRVMNHLSCSNVPVGCIGFQVEGEVTGIYYSDCDSFLDENGVRTSNMKSLLTTEEKKEADRVHSIARGSLVSPYSEYLVKVNKVTAVWVSKSAKRDIKRVAEFLAAKRNIKLITIGE